MHELSIIVHVAKTIDELAKENELTKVGKVVLECGEVTGVIPELMYDCWNYYRKKYPVMEESEMVIETIPAVTFCEDCKKEYETVKHGRICPYCGSEHTYLVVGNECIIKEITAQ